MLYVNKHYIFFIFLTLLLPFAQLSANSNPWTAIQEEDFTKQGLDRQIVPQKYLTFELDMDELQAILTQAPMRFSPASYGPAVVLALPMPNGEMEKFQIFDAPIMHPDLASRYPMIHAYAGIGLDDKTASLRFDVTQFGFHAMVISGKHSTVFIDPYAKGDTQHYITYYKKDFFKEGNFECHFSDETQYAFPSSSVENTPDNVVMRTYRLAIGCTFEYASYHGGTKPDAMAAIHTSMTRVNGIYERDVAVSMQMVANNDELIFIDSNDPYTNDEQGLLMLEHQALCDDIIGNENYDVGQVLCTSVGGSAYRGSACVEGMKGSAVSGTFPPVGDPLDIEYIAHESGHQFGCSHTGNECNTTLATSFEPGSASTVMKTFLCPVQIQPVGDGYFHAINILEINDHLKMGPPSSCAIETETANTPPIVDAGNDHYNLPISTPFKLTATGQDTDGDILTYCWEQMNNEKVSNPPQSNYTEGPAFRSREPVAEPYRYFPAIDYIVSGTDYEWEVLPSVSRSINFRLTARDNFMGAGSTDYDDIQLNFTDYAGPFLVQSPNTNQVWYAGAAQTVNWEVANTNEAPVSCRNVDILLSVDGGYTYPIVLASSVPNDGSHVIEVPDTATESARVMVFCSDNVFFDISDEDFTIAAASTPTIAVAVDAPTQSVCGNAESVEYHFSFTALAGFEEEVSIDATGIPAGATFSFSQNTFMPDETVTLSIESLENVVSGNYTINIVGTTASTTLTQTIVLQINNELPEPILFIAPAHGISATSLTPTFEWAGGNNANQFIEIATSPGFGSTVVETSPVSTNSYTPDNALEPLKTYYWRIRSDNVCATSNTAWSSFMTGGEGCYSYYNTSPTYVHSYIMNTSSIIVVPDPLIIEDVTVDIQALHKNVGDLTAQLISPSGSEIELFNRPGFPAIEVGCTRDNMLVDFNDSAPNTANDFENTCISGADYGIEGSFQPSTPLSDLNGQNALGEWTLTMFDDKPGHAGSLEEWSIAFCFSQAQGAAPEFTKSTLEAPTEGSISITNTNLLAISPTNTASQIYYTLLELPTEGFLTYNGEMATIGTSFSQQDIDNNLLSYTHTNVPISPDQFRFDIATNDGGWIQDEFLNINIGNVSKLKAFEYDLAFELFPNPTDGHLHLIINEASTSGLVFQVYDMNGKLTRAFELNTSGRYIQQQIELSFLPAGIYEVVITDGLKYGRKRFVKM